MSPKDSYWYRLWLHGKIQMTKCNWQPQAMLAFIEYALLEDEWPDEEKQEEIAEGIVKGK